MGRKRWIIWSRSAIKSSSKMSFLTRPEFHATEIEFLRLGITFLLSPSCFVKMVFLNLHGVLTLENNFIKMLISSYNFSHKLVNKKLSIFTFHDLSPIGKIKSNLQLIFIWISCTVKFNTKNYIMSNWNCTSVMNFTNFLMCLSQGHSFFRANIRSLEQASWLNSPQAVSSAGAKKA